MFVMNKNVHHNGKHYQKGFEVSESDGAFKDLKAMGHISEEVKSLGSVDAEVSAPVEAPAPMPEVEEESHSKKRGRR